MSSDAFTRLEIPRLSGPALDHERDRARARGHAAGYAEGMRLAAARAERDAAERAEQRRRADDHDRARVAGTVAALEAAVARFDAHAAALTAPSVAEMHTRAVELAETIVEHELSDPVRSAITVATRVENALAGASDEVADLVAAGASPVVRLSPRDAEAVADSAASGVATIAGVVVIESDPSLAPGEAIVRLADGAVDLRVAAAFARARRALEEGA
ncbi:FliH/SctL family protein [Microbacterium sp. cf332]|uniref:FliH/SctL family protein n=1 Tax=Microbacterium sp. cf332 TaxID=1761804 RepID=UPI0008863232|nr:FliH/SctL family protein [Microbacterium sp. cf332]SDQ50512.1 flagellar assembly protein FliH [Microbacterium sp. cf332]